MKNKYLTLMMYGMLGESITTPLPRFKTPDNGSGSLIDSDDPEKIEKAERKRAMRKAKRLKQLNVQSQLRTEKPKEGA